MFLSQKIFADTVGFTAYPAELIFTEQTYDIWHEGKYAGFCALVQDGETLTIRRLYLEGKAPRFFFRQPEPRHEQGFQNKGLGAAIITSLYEHALSSGFKFLKIYCTRSMNLIALTNNRFTDVQFIPNEIANKGQAFAAEFGNIDWVYTLNKYTFILPDQSKLNYRQLADGRFLADGHNVSLYFPEIRDGQFLLKNKLDGSCLGREQGLRIEIDRYVDILIPLA